MWYLFAGMLLAAGLAVVIGVLDHWREPPHLHFLPVEAAGLDLQQDVTLATAAGTGPDRPLRYDLPPPPHSVGAGGGDDDAGGGHALGATDTSSFSSIDGKKVF